MKPIYFLLLAVFAICPLSAFGSEADVIAARQTRISDGVSHFNSLLNTSSSESLLTILISLNKRVSVAYIRNLEESCLSTAIDVHASVGELVHVYRLPMSWRDHLDVTEIELRNAVAASVEVVLSEETDYIAALVAAAATESTIEDSISNQHRQHWASQAKQHMELARERRESGDGNVISGVLIGTTAQQASCIVNTLGGDVLVIEPSSERFRQTSLSIDYYLPPAE